MHRSARVVVAASILVFTTTSSSGAASLCGDVNSNGAVTSSDALNVLKKSVGQNVDLVCPDYINRYGEPADTNKSSTFTKDYLLGPKVTIEKAAKVTHLGMIAREGGHKVRLALYKDTAGAPTQLLVATPETTLVPGSQEIPVAETSVSAGDYWIMGVYDTDVAMAADENAPPGPIISYRALTYGSALPDPFGPTETYGETTINYWVKVKQ